MKPIQTVLPNTDKLPNRWTGLTALCLAGLGLWGIIVGCSGPCQTGLSGKALMDAFEADEAAMPWLMAGAVFSLVGMAIGAFYYQSRNGRCAVAIALFAVTWAYLRRGHF